MEDQHDPLADQELRLLWTRFEGLVGHQLCRLRSDDGPEIAAPPSTPAASSGSSPYHVSCSSIVVNSVLTSRVSSRASNFDPVSSPARLESAGDPLLQLEQSSVDEDDGEVEGTASSSNVVRDVGVAENSVGSGRGGGIKEDVAARKKSKERVGDGVVGCGDVYEGSFEITGGGGGGIGVHVGDGVFVENREGEVKVVRKGGNGGCGHEAGSCRGRSRSVVQLDSGYRAAGGGGGDNSVVGDSTSCCLLSVEGDLEMDPSRQSQASSEDGSGAGKMTRRNSSTNALHTSETQPLFGLPYVAKAAGPLLSLLMLNLEEREGQSGTPPATMQSLEEETRNMIGVYKQSLLLESQLHQYLNPGLITSLNRRVAKATFEADTMVNLIEKIRRETKRSAPESDRLRKVYDVSQKLKCMLGRQKCEWQCVGRLKETLTMAKEMKDLLKFIARLSNILERSKSALGGLQEKPPPYEYCSPYDSVVKAEWHNVDTQMVPGDSENQSSHSIGRDKQDGGNLQAGRQPGDPFAGGKAPILLSSSRKDSPPKQESGDQYNPSRRESWWMDPASGKLRIRGRSESPRKIVRSPWIQRSRSFEDDLESSSSTRSAPVSGKKSKSSSRPRSSSPNSNTSRSIQFTNGPTPSKSSDTDGRPRWLARNSARDSKDSRDSSSRMRFMGRSSATSSGSMKERILVDKQMAQECAQRLATGSCLKPENPPNVCHEDRRSQRRSRPENPPQAREKERFGGQLRAIKSHKLSDTDRRRSHRYREEDSAEVCDEDRRKHGDDTCESVCESYPSGRKGKQKHPPASCDERRPSRKHAEEDCKDVCEPYRSGRKSRKEDPPSVCDEGRPSLKRSKKGGSEVCKEDPRQKCERERRNRFQNVTCGSPPRACPRDELRQCRVDDERSRSGSPCKKHRRESKCSEDPCTFELPCQEERKCPPCLFPRRSSCSSRAALEMQDPCDAEPYEEKDFCKNKMPPSPRLPSPAKATPRSTGGRSSASRSNVSRNKATGSDTPYEDASEDVSTQGSESDRSNSILIDINTECPCSKNSSCPGDCCCCRKISVKVKRKGASGTPRSPTKGGKASASVKPKTAISDDGLNESSAKETMPSTYTGPAKTPSSLGAGKKSPSGMSSPVKSSAAELAVTQSAANQGASQKASPQVSPSPSKVVAAAAQESGGGEESGNGEELKWWQKKPETVEDWLKLLIPLLLLLWLLFILLTSLLSCCGCQWVPNPFFFLTNFFVGRVTLRHHGPAPV